MFYHNVHLVPLHIPNDEQDSFRERLYEIPYLLYEVEQLSNGDKIVINKPGGKRNFGRLDQNDLMVFIYSPDDDSLWLISHKEILNDLCEKRIHDENATVNLVKGLFAVCCGEEPSSVIRTMRLQDTVGLPVEAILKVYKWIWGQEDCNYPRQQGRWLSMEAILEEFGMSRQELEEELG